MGRFKGKKEEEEEEEEEERLKGRDRFRPGVRAAEPPSRTAPSPEPPTS